MPRATDWTLHDGRNNKIEVSVGGRFTVNNVGMMSALAVNGQGIALLAERIAGDDFAEGRLKRVLPAWEGTSVAIHAITETRLLPAKTQRFIEFLQEQMGRR
jgi:DNA-binding transcriptional LysR family regulator